MKYKGKVVSGSSLLTILGVVCFATVLVAAAVLMASVTWTNTPTNGATITKHDVVVHSGTALIASPIVGKNYTFDLQIIGSTVATAQLTIDIGKAGIGIASGDVILRYWDGAAWTTLVANTGTTDHLVYTYATTTSLTVGSDVTYGFELTYTLAGTYVCNGYVNLV